MKIKKRERERECSNGRDGRNSCTPVCTDRRNAIAIDGTGSRAKGLGAIQV